MIRHIVMWNHKVEFNDEQKEMNAKKVKDELEGLTQVVNGIISLNVTINPLTSSNREVILDSLFESEDDLQKYQVHPEHVRVSHFVGTVLNDRACIDFNEEK